MSGCGVFADWTSFEWFPSRLLGSPERRVVGNWMRVVERWMSKMASFFLKKKKWNFEVLSGLTPVESRLNVRL